MFVLLKLGLVTCAFYAGITILMFVGLIILVHLIGSVGISLNWRSFTLVFAVVWLISFTAAWHLVIPRAASR